MAEVVRRNRVELHARALHESRCDRIGQLGERCLAGEVTGCSFGRSFSRHPRDTHQLPYVDDHFRVTNEETEIVGIGVDRGNGKPSVNTRLLQDVADLFFRGLVKLMVGDRLQRLIPILPLSRSNVTRVICIGERPRGSDGQCADAYQCHYAESRKTMLWSYDH